MKMAFENGNKKDGKHYWLTPPELMESLQAEFDFDFDPCPYPKPEEFDGLDVEWGSSNYVNPPFGVVMHKGKKKGATAWVRKAIMEHQKGKKVVFVYPIDKWVLMLLDAGAKVRNLRDVKWMATEDGSEGSGTGRHVACFVLDPEFSNTKADDTSIRLSEIDMQIRYLRSEKHKAQKNGNETYNNWCSNAIHDLVIERETLQNNQDDKRKKFNGRVVR